MFCTNKSCRDYQTTGFHAEFVDGVTVCPTCGQPLVDELEPDDAWDEAPSVAPSCGAGGQAFVDFEPVLETDDPDDVPALRGLLDAAWIPHLVLRPDQLGPLRESRPSMDFEPAEGSFVFLVPSSLSEDAREVFAMVDDEEPGP